METSVTPSIPAQFFFSRLVALNLHLQLMHMNSAREMMIDCKG